MSRRAHPSVPSPETGPLTVAGLAALVVGALLAVLALAAPFATPARAAATVVVTSDFEDGLGGWQGRGDAAVSLTTQNTRGSQSLLVTGRTQSWNGASLPVTTTFAPGVTYTVSLWLRLPSTGTGYADLRVSVQRDNAGESSYDTVATATGVTSGGWQQVTASYTPGPFDSAQLYVESTDSLTDILVDDVVVTGDRLTPDLTLPALDTTLQPWFPFGIAVEPADVLAGRGELVAHHAAQITPGNQMKPDAIQPTEGEFRFGPADQLVDFAVEHGQRVYGHTLVWHQQTPQWWFERNDGVALTTSADDQALLRSRLRTHIRAIADHYRETYGEFGTPGNPIVAFDVVNEVIDESQPDGLRRSEWYRILGPSYIANAFTYARAAFGPEVKLFINDYNSEYPNKRAPYLALVTSLLEQGVPVDGVGHQLHVEVGRSLSNIEATITAFEGLGVTQAVTELDVSTYLHGGESWTTPPAERLLEQAYYYRDLFAVLKRHASSFESVTVWGVDDSRTWLRSGAAPLLFDGRLQAKSAFWGIVDPSRIGTTAPPPPPPPTPTPTPTPTATPTGGPAACSVRWVGNAWNTGLTANVRVTNTGSATIDGWTLTFDFPNGQKVTQGWSAEWSQTGSAVTATNAPWNGRLAAGSSVEIGFNASHPGTPTAPTAFRLNGAPCAAG